MLNLRITLIAFLLIPLFSVAADSENTVEPKSPTDPSATVQKKETDKKIEVDDKTVLPKTTGKTLKEKKLSKAFELFIPSEKISADNAVPFPVDI